MHITLSLSIIGTLIFLSGCTIEKQYSIAETPAQKPVRDLKPALPNSRRIPKSALQGDFHYMKSLGRIESPGPQNGGIIHGMHLDSDVIVRFDIKETSLDIVSKQVRFQEYDSYFPNARPKGQELNSVVASFPIRHVDVLKKQDANGEETHEEEVTETRRLYSDREFIELDPDANDRLSDFANDTLKTNNPNGISRDPSSGALNFSVERTLQDNTLVEEKYSFLPNRKSGYVPMPYSGALERSFGFFKTTIYQRDAYNRITTNGKRVYAHRWDLSKPIVYYFSKDFPETLVSGAEKVFAQWNSAFQEATGITNALQLRRNSGQEIGDLRFNMIHYEPTVDTRHGVLGYGPSVVDPNTGEIIKADVILFGGLLKRVLHREREWDALGVPSSGSSNVSAGIKGGGEPKGMELFLPFASPAHTVEAIAAAGHRDDPLRFALQTKEGLAGLITAERQSAMRDLQHSVTRLEGGVLESISSSMNVDKSDAELEVQIFIPLLAHELGHNLGLRHNFMGSADKAHYGHTQSSSVMDYHFLSEEEPQGPGLYDRAAIRVAYGQPTQIPALLQENFLYCTDENTYDSRFGLCNQFDSGSTLKSLIENQSKRYFQSYKVNNLNQGEEFFGTQGATAGYRSRVQRSLIPLRLAYDNANAILEVFSSENFTASDVQNQKIGLLKLWTLLGQRIEADRSTDGSNRLDLNLKGGTTIALDLRKLAPAIEDAKNAKQAAFLAMLQILLMEDQDRPHYDVRDPLSEELLIRGVLFDKLFTLLLLGQKLPSPSEPGALTSPIESMNNNAGRSLFSFLLSNTFPQPGSLGTHAQGLRIFDINLRLMARYVLEDAIGYGGSSGTLRELFSLNKVILHAADTDKDSLAFKQAEEKRQQIVTLLADLVRGGFTLPERIAKKAQVDLLMEERAALPVAFTRSVNSEFFMAPLESDSGSETATGLLITHEIYALEDQVAAMTKVRDEVKAQIREETKKSAPDKELLTRLEGQVSQLQRNINNVGRHLAGERQFLQSYYELFNR